MSTNPKSRKALLVVTEVAISSLESGAKIRLSTVYFHLKNLGYEIEVKSIGDYLKARQDSKDIIVVVSYACARAIPKAKQESEFIWFDATDSWHISRKSRILRGEIRQVFALFRDLFYLRRVRSIDLLTFISKRDLIREAKFAEVKSQYAFVLPNQVFQAKLSDKCMNRLVFIGDGVYGPNRRALRFLEKVVEELPPDRRITAIGRSLASKSRKIDCVGYLAKENLYFRDDIHVVPVFSGAGVKNKVVEPLSLGLRVVTTKEGANGLARNSNLYICKTPSEFARRISELEEINHQNKLRNQGLYLHDDLNSILNLLETHSGGFLNS